jgi:hypothetical protein
MTTIEKISQQTGNLPETYQMEVLDFVEYLTIKTNKKVGVSLLEEQEWSKFSLSQAMEGLEYEDFPPYTESDLIEKWQ